MRPKVRRLERMTDTHMITPTKANAVTKPLCSRPFSMRSHISATSYWCADGGNFRGLIGQGFTFMGPADQGNGAAADHHRTDRRQHRHRTAMQGRDHVL